MPVGTADDRAFVAEKLNNMHVSEVTDCVISLAAPNNAEEKVVFLFNSCCGHTAYEVTLEMALQMIVGMTGALEYLATMKTKMKGNSEDEGE